MIMAHPAHMTSNAQGNLLIGGNDNVGRTMNNALEQENLTLSTLNLQTGSCLTSDTNLMTQQQTHALTASCGSALTRDVGVDRNTSLVGHAREEDDDEDDEQQQTQQQLPPPPRVPTALALTQHLVTDDDPDEKPTPPLKSTRLESYRADVERRNLGSTFIHEPGETTRRAGRGNAGAAEPKRAGAGRVDDDDDDDDWDNSLDEDEDDEDDQEEDYKVFGRATLKAQSSALAQVLEQERRGTSKRF